jgi:hypothetical protein
LINEIENKESEDSVFKISIHSNKTTSDWTDLDEISFDLRDRKSLTEFSRTVLKSL